MEISIIRTLFLAFFIPSVTNGQSAEDSVLTLKQCIQLSFANNQKLKQVQLETEKSRHKLSEAVSSGLPQIGGIASFDYYFSIPVTMVSGEIAGQPGIMVPVELGTRYNVNAGIQAGQMIYNASYSSSLQLFKKACEITDLTLQKSKEELAYNITQLYFFIQITNKQLTLLDSNYSALSKIYGFSDQLYRNGFIRKAEQDRITVAMNNLAAEKENLLLIRNQQLNMLKYLVGISLYQDLKLSEELEDLTGFSNSIDTSFNNQIDNILIEKQKELAMINLKLSRADKFPSLAGYAVYSYQSPVEEFDLLGARENWYKTSYVGLKLQVPIFEGKRLKSKTSQRKTELAQITAAQMDLQHELNVRYTNAIHKYTICKSLESKQSVNNDLSEDILNITYREYQQGLKSFTDILNAQSEYNLSTLSWLNSILQIRLAELELLRLSGTLHSLFL